ncbi:type I pullulanase [Clostridium sp.]|uniref:type I pullulanase n=1 Tax=Clostridium sp. TaxID=1506 RepID=UPI0026250021|nr:type I pullulanase [Clostridium sp.]
MKKLNIKEIDNLYSYDKEDLGYKFKNNKHFFKIWSPIVDSMILCIYDNYDELEKIEYPMTKKEKGIWEIILEENLEEKYYTFIALIGNEKNEGVDPYAKALSVNGEKGAIIDMGKTNPDNWENHIRPRKLYGTDSIIYEVSIRDLSIDEESGIKNKGKFLGLTEENTVGIYNIKTGLSHIKDLGVTHIQLLPIYDFATIDESKELDKDIYNWGYDPENYNSPEGSYSTNPYNPVTRIKELKEGIKTIHENGMSVIMDVVYNHMYDVKKSGFHKLMPGYYFRYDNKGNLSNESMCGNALASENVMVRKFIVDSVKYWTKEYKIDGFRFDLMGLIDVETMNKIREEVDKIDSNIIIIGEGWNMPSIVSDENKAIQTNAYKLKDIAFFNDKIRDGLRGNPFSNEVKGFLSGEDNKELDVKSAIVGGIKYSSKIETFGEVSPNQVVNYIECHDNHTLYDKLKLTVKDENELKYMHRLGTSIILLSQGIPFIHAGQEFLRTKNGIENSYNASDLVNKLNWRRKYENMDTVNYVKGLIRLRKEYLAFRMRTVEEIKKHLVFIDSPNNCIAYKIINNVNYDDYKEIIVVHNANKVHTEICLDSFGTFNVLVNKEKSGIDIIETIKGNKINIQALSTLVIGKVK